MLDFVGEGTEDQRFDFGHGLGFRRAIRHGTGELRHLGNPPPIGFPFDFNSHFRNVAGGTYGASNSWSRRMGAEREERLGGWNEATEECDDLAVVTVDQVTTLHRMARAKAAGLTPRRGARWF